MKRFITSITIICLTLTLLAFPFAGGLSATDSPEKPELKIEAVYAGVNGDAAPSQKIITIKVPSDPQYTLRLTDEVRLMVKDQSGSSRELKAKVVGTQYIEALVPEKKNEQGQKVEFVIDRLSIWINRDADEIYSFDFNKVESNMPSLTELITKTVSPAGPIEVKGYGLEGLRECEVNVGGSKANVGNATGNNATLRPASGTFSTGPGKAIAIEFDDQDDSRSYFLINKKIYNEAVNIFAPLDLDGNRIRLSPTMGPRGSEIRFTGNNLDTRGYDIYFIPYSPTHNELDNMKYYNDDYLASKKASFSSEQIIAHVPDKLATGPYYVVFTNPNSQREGVKSRWVLKKISGENVSNQEQLFRIVENIDQVNVTNVLPDKAVCKIKTPVTIRGYNFKKIPFFTGEIENENNGMEIKNQEDGSWEFKSTTGILQLGDGDSVENVVVIRRIDVDIGYVEGKSLPIERFITGADGISSIEVTTREFDTSVTKEEKVKVTFTNYYYLQDENGEPGELLYIYKQVDNKHKFTYLPATETPEGSRMTPQVIPLQEKGGQYIIHPMTGRLQVRIEGKKFLAVRHGTGANLKTHYPMIKLGELTIDPNNSQLQAGEYDADRKIYRPLHFTMLKNGQELRINDPDPLADTIVFEIDSAKEIAASNNPEMSYPVEIRNPMRNSDQFWDWTPIGINVQFKVIGENNFPVITNVHPSLLPVQGGEEVVITGKNLLKEARVYIDGKEVSGVRYSGNNEQIKLIAPPGREGETLLQVENPGGGTASHPFFYTRTFTEPRLDSITPDEGGIRTLVTVKGQNFIAPDMSINVPEQFDIDENNYLNESLIYRLIGSRVFMDGYDINEYNRNNRNEITLQPYQGGAVLTVRNDQAALGAGYDSVVFYDRSQSSGQEKFFTIQADARNILWINGVHERYRVVYDKGQFYAVNGNQQYKISGGSGTISFAGKNLHAYTPFKISQVNGQSVITGNRVRYIDPQTLEFEIPVLDQAPWTGPSTGGDGYDVSVVNPDTKKATLKNAFKYLGTSTRCPEVIDVIPYQGPDEGGNMIEIIGPQRTDDRVGFMDTGTRKTRVFFGTQEADPRALVVSADGTRITLKVPAYPEKIKDKQTDRFTVPIVLVNPDGGTFSISFRYPLDVAREGQGSAEQTFKTIYGYTYVVPNSSPVIDSIEPREGSARGAYEVEIFGSDFRDFEPFTDINGNSRHDEGEPYTDLDGDGAYTDRYDKAQDFKQKTSKYDPEREYLSTVLLPKVIFGNQEAEIVKFSSGYMQVLVPPGSGTVDVYVVNNDAGISNKVKFTYKSSSPQIKSVIPAVGKKEGGEPVSIHGTGFEEDRIMILGPDGRIEKRAMPMVRLGQLSNRDLPREHENSGLVKSGQARVVLASGLTVHYDAENKRLDLSQRRGADEYSASYSWYADEQPVVYINMRDLRIHDTDVYPYEELIRCEMQTRSEAANRMIVEQGYAPEAEWISSSQVDLRTPGYYTVGKVPLLLINPDRGTARSEFEYKNPDSKPTITNITRDGKSPQEINIDGIKRIVRVNYKGQSVISVFGTDFRENASIQMGERITIGWKDITPTLPNKLTFTMPAVPESEVGKLYRVVVVNEDGGTAASDQLDPPIYIQITKGETEPQITALKPALGPASGGTRVTIEGHDFRGKLEGFTGEQLQVYFGEFRAADVEVLDYKTIKALTPGNLPGKREVRIENPDGELSIPGGEFTYISTPNITAVVDPSDPTENSRIRNVSVQGGQEIKIKGSGFMPGARVVFMPELETLADTATPGPNILYRPRTVLVDGKSSNVLSYSQLKSGFDGTDTKFIDTETLTVRVPAGKLDGKGIIVINPDNGTSEPYDDLKYGLPGIDAPQGVKADLVRDQYHNTDRYIKVSWNPVEKAGQYDIYVVVEGKTPEYVGSTRLTSFLYKDLEPRTTYKFIVKAVGDFGSSAPSAMSNEVRTGYRVGAPDEDGSLGEYTQQKKVGNRAEVVIGTRDFDQDRIIIDLTSGLLAGSREVVITMPAEVVSSYRARDIELVGADFSLRLNPGAFNLGIVQQNRYRSDAGVRFHLAPTAGKPSGGKTALSKVYQLEATAFVGKSATAIDRVSRDIYLALDYDPRGAEMLRIKSPGLYRWDDSLYDWTTSQNWKVNYPGAMLPLNRMGSYTIMGTRR
ncbi:MAG TPA: hypothetical protein GX404_05460 [Syntrophomonadaceae bacterium]|nr:hypothetical protein [Syntrophomonadaceae bacterium]